MTEPVMMPSLSSLDKIALRQLIVARLRGTQAPDASTPFHIAGVSRDQYSLIEHLLPVQRIQAAVLVPIVDRPEGLSVLFTQRATHLRNHAGQISFPGGRIEAHDDGPAATALRETEEEIGLSHELIEVVGYLPPHLIFTGYTVVPVVGFVQPDFELSLDSGEVAETFEAPLQFFLDAANHQVRERAIGDMMALVYDFPYGGRRIWGATAGMLISLYHLLSQR